MKKTYFAALVLMTGFTSTVLAQSAIPVDLTGKATVSARIVLAKVSDLDFKNVNPGVTKAIDFAGTVTPTATATGSETAGQFTITKAAKTQVTLGLAGLTALSGPSSASLATTYTHQISMLGQPSVTISTPSSFTVAQSGDTNPYWNATTFNLDLGGQVSPIPTQATGDYTATITLSATYN